MNVEKLLGSIWYKNQNFVNVHLTLQGELEMLNSEKEHQVLAAANMWSNVFHNYRAHTPDECKQLPFYTIFTNRQAQALLKMCESQGIV